ncbi:MAG: rhomboid family intramembrane serine protease [Polyangia bacterium]
MDLLDPSLGFTSPVTVRFRALVEHFLQSTEEIKLLSYKDGEAQLSLERPGKKPVFIVLVDAAREDERSLRLRLARLVSESVADQSVVFVANHGWMADALKKAATEFYPRLSLYQLSSDGALEHKQGSPPPILRAALAAQKPLPPGQQTLEPDEAFAKRCAAAEEERQRISEAFSDEFKRRSAPVTLSLVGLGLLLFVLGRVWTQNGDTATTLVQLGAKVPVFIRGGEGWRLLSALPLHSDVIGAAVNSLVLLSLGIVLEKLLGSARFVVLFVVSGLCGSLVGTFGPTSLQAVVGVGSTGALFGLLSAAAVRALRPSGLPAAMAVRLTRLALLNLGFNIFLSLLPELGRLLRLGFIATQPGLDRLAHLGGLLGGAALLATGALRTLRVGDKPDQPQRAELVHLGLAILLGLLLAASIGVALYRGAPWHPDRSWRDRLGKTALKESLALPPEAAAGTPGAAPARTFSEEDLKLLRRALGDSGVSLEVPALLGKPSEQFGDGRATVYELGDLDKTLQLLQVTITPVKKPIKKARLSGELDRAGNALKAEKNKAIEAGELALTAPPVTEEVGGWPTMELRFQSPDGRRARALLQQRPRYSIKLWYVHADVLSESTQVDLRRLLQSVQDGTAAPGTKGTPDKKDGKKGKKRRR